MRASTDLVTISTQSYGFLALIWNRWCTCTGSEWDATCNLTQSRLRSRSSLSYATKYLLNYARVGRFDVVMSFELLRLI